MSCFWKLAIITQTHRNNTPGPINSMCLILFAYNVDPRYRLVVAANRDEFYQRPTRRLCFWPEAPQLLAGQDLEAGGTWLGITRNGRFAAVTNVREGTASVGAGLRSRGELPLDYLLAELGTEEYLQRCQQRANQYAGYNLLLADRNGLYYSSNRNDQQPQTLAPGVYGLSNAALDSPWPKVSDGSAALRQLIDSNQLSVTALLALLQHKLPPDDHRLPDTGVGIEWERRLGPRFIESENYGTRSSLVLLQDYDGNTEVVEQSYWPHWHQPQSYRFSIE